MDSESTEKNIQGSESTRPRNLKNNLVVGSDAFVYEFMMIRSWEWSV